MALLKASKRSDAGTRRARRLREEGRIPGVLYGHGQPTQPLTLDEHDLELAVSHGERLLEIELEGATENALIKEVQFDTFGHHILHVDLARVDLDERVEVTVPIVLRGIPAGADEGGVLHQVSASATIECTVRSIPDDLRATVNEMKVGDSMPMSQLPLPEGAKLLSDPNAIVCTVSLVAEEVAAPTEEVAATAEPEVIGEKKEDEEAAEGAEEGKEKK